MTPDGVLTIPDKNRGNDAHQPLFLDSDLNGPDDMGDWWLDLGRIDLPA